MQILLENGGYHWRNHGDIAMLQVTISRLKSFWPDSSMTVFTYAPDLLTSRFSDALPLLPHTRTLWLENQYLIGGNQKYVPRWLYERSFTLDQMARHRLPGLAQLWIRRRMNRRGIDSEFYDILSKTDLVVASGGGYFNDAFETHAIKVLGMLEVATRLGKPTALFGQGLGPMQSQRLVSKAKDVLPAVNIIALRENRVGPALLQSLGVTSDRVIVTGDDTIELAYEARAKELGMGIGVNLRIASYSEVEEDVVGPVRLVLHETTRTHNAPLIPLPISLHKEESDVEAISQLVAGYTDQPDNGQSLDTPRKVIQNVSQCRLVVTGSYHAGVFALAQGIPAICLAKSQYYKDKFLGLADQFGKGKGCQVVFLDDNQLQKRLATAIDDAWQIAEQIRPQLLDAARQQIKLSRAAYQEFFNFVEAKKL